MKKSKTSNREKRQLTKKTTLLLKKSNYVKVNRFKPKQWTRKCQNRYCRNGCSYKISQKVYKRRSLKYRNPEFEKLHYKRVDVIVTMS